MAVACMEMWIITHTVDHTPFQSAQRGHMFTKQNKSSRLELSLFFGCDHMEQAVRLLGFSIPFNKNNYHSSG